MKKKSVHKSGRRGQEVVHAASAERIQVGDIVRRVPITFFDRDSRSAASMRGRVVYVHPLGRFHVVEFGQGKRAVRESFMGAER